jgi:hypothetical protein
MANKKSLMSTGVAVLIPNILPKIAPENPQATM